MGAKKPGSKYVPSFIPPSLLGTPKPKAFDDDDEEEEVRTVWGVWQWVVARTLCGEK